MRIVIDQELCQGHGVCESEAPTVFSVAPKSSNVIVLNEYPDESLRPQVRAAVKYCPTHAITLSEEE